MNANRIFAATTIMGLLPTLAAAQEPFDYEKTKAQYSVREYATSPLSESGYGYYQVAENAWFVHDDFENMVFFVTDDGVVVVDPKPDVSPFVLEVIPQVTDKPITHVIYSHHHRDHSQGAYLFPEDAILIAEQDTADLLAVANDPKRPQPDVVFDDEYVLETGGLRLEMKDLGRNWHSQDDIVIWAPEQKILFAVDMFHPDAAPWIHWGESSDPFFAFGLPDLLLSQYDFNFVIVGHERIVGTPELMQTYNSFIGDMEQTLMGIAQSEWFQTAAQEAAMRYAPDATHYAYKETAMIAANACATQMIEKWSGRVRNAPLNMVENCQTMFMHLIILDP
ncbi:MAG: MBL fold metallo-hydrolase [Woeseiaceae bacterium]|nr:MBL fold metallo-hydrolase [Alphaproteobacteria bacterium]